MMPYNTELYHFGILGMKWGVRRFQNPDGTFTAAGKKRYGTSENYERRLGNQFYKSSEVQVVRNSDGSKTKMTKEIVEAGRKWVKQLPDISMQDALKDLALM